MARGVKWDLAVIKELASEKGGECLSNGYEGIFAQLNWRCGCGHEWKATFNHIKRGQWCPQCAIKRAALLRTKYSIEELRATAEARGGECLSAAYKPFEKHMWRCEYGHEWLATVNSIKAGSWCPRCAINNTAETNAKWEIEDLRAHAISLGGECLSKTFVRGEKQQWKCSLGHTWDSYWRSVKRGRTWCPRCSKTKNAKVHISGKIENLRKHAIAKGGECLSEIYEGTAKKYLWRCEHGHEWVAIWNNVRSGTWCPWCLLNHRNRFPYEVERRENRTTRPPIIQSAAD
jgi:hypothetical protein